MLRITSQNRYGATALVLEGKLIGPWPCPWVEELEKTWRLAGTEARLQVDVSQVSYVSAAGEPLLHQMHHRGTELTAESPLMK